MRKRGSTLEYAEARRGDLLRAYRRELREARHIDIDIILQRVSLSPAPRFYVSEERAAAVVSRMLRGRPVGRMRDNKREMFRELLRRTRGILAASPGMSVADAVAMAVSTPAPRFYLTARTIGEIIRHGRASRHTAGKGTADNGNGERDRTRTTDKGNTT